MTISVEPIDTYHERIRGTIDRTLCLYPDRVVVSGQYSFGARFEKPVSLEDLREDTGKFWARRRTFRLSVYAIVMLSPVWIVPFFSPMESHVLAIFFGIYGLAIVYFLTTLRRIEYTQFRNDSGFVLLDVGRTGPDRDRYDEFVENVKRQIRVVRSSK